MGGALAAIEQGYIQGEIQEAAYRYQQAVERQEQIVVGVNQFEVQEEIELERLAVDPAIEIGQQERLAKLRAGRHTHKVSDLLTRLTITAKGEENLLPLLIECVENNITLGEICNVLRQEWGEYHPTGL